MTDTTISDAVAFPQDDGTGVADGSEDWVSAGYLSLLGEHTGGEYVSNGLSFQNITTTDGSESVDVTAGHAFIVDDSSSTSSARSSGGNVKVQGGTTNAYDTTLPNGSQNAYVVVLPTDVTGLGLDTDTNNDLWLAVDVTANDSVYIRHGNGLSAPSDPHIKLGTVDSAGGATTRPNDGNKLSNVDELTISGWNVLDMVELGADPTGGTSTDAAQILENNLADKTVFVFPPGDYYWGHSVVQDGYSDVKLIGKGFPRLFVDGSTTFAGATKFFELGQTTVFTDLTIKNFELDGSGRTNGCGVADLFVDDGLHVENVKLTGAMDIDQECILTGVGNVDGYGLYRNVRLPDGGFANVSTGATGFNDTASGHDGTLEVIGCYIANFEDNGFRSGPGDPGKVHFIRCVGEDNGKEQFRIGGHGGSVVDCHAIKNGTISDTFNANIKGYRIEDAKDCTIKDCTIEYSGGDLDGGNALRISGPVEKCTVDGFHADYGGSSNVVRVDAGTNSSPFLGADVPDVTLRDVRVEDSGGSDAFNIDRANVRLVDPVVDGNGTGTTGIDIVSADDVKIVRPAIRNCAEGIIVGGNHTKISNPVEFSSNTTDVDDGTRTSADTDLIGFRGDESFTTSTRTRWNGVIGGGPLGGVDLSTTTGQYDGDEAIADGTSTASAGDYARWDSANTQWIVFNQDSTV